MIGRWGKAAATVVLGAAVTVDLGLATALLDHASTDLPLAWSSLQGLQGPDPRLALAGRAALGSGAIAGLATAAAAIVAGCAAAQLSGATRALLIACIRLPAVTVLLIGVGAAFLLARNGPIVASLGGVSVASRALGVLWTSVLIFLPVAALELERAARRLDQSGLESIATFGIGPLSRLFRIALPTVLSAAARVAVVGFATATVGFFLIAWPVPARQAAGSAVAATVAGPPLAALAFCAAAVLISVAAIGARAKH